jgi:hypothetical protein
MLFVDCLVDNPEFDSQVKERLTTPEGRFGSVCALPASSPLVRATLQLPGLLEALVVELARRRQRALTRLATKVSLRAAARQQPPPSSMLCALAAAGGASRRQGRRQPADRRPRRCRVRGRARRA